MVKLEKKQVKIVSVLIALAFIGSVVALALAQSGSGLASAPVPCLSCRLRRLLRPAPR